MGKVKKRYLHLVWWKRCSMNTTQKGQFRNCRETQYLHQHRGWGPSSKFCVLNFAFFLVFVVCVSGCHGNSVRGSVSKWGVLCLLCFELCLLCWCLVFSILIIGGGCVKISVVLCWHEMEDSTVTRDPRACLAWFSLVKMESQPMFFWNSWKSDLKIGL